MSLNWKVEESEKNKTIVVTLEVSPQEYKINQPIDAPIKIGCIEVMKYLQKNNYKYGKVLKNDTVTNRSDQNCRGTWIFELKKTTSPKKQTTTRRKRSSTKKTSTNS